MTRMLTFGAVVLCLASATGCTDLKPLQAQVDELVSAGRLVPFGYYGWSTWIGQWQRN